MLSEDEVLFRDAVRQFAQTEITPRVAEMDESQRIDPALIPQFFELGLMAIEVPERFGGAESSFFTAVLVVEDARIPSLSSFFPTEKPSDSRSTTKAVIPRYPASGSALAKMT